MRHWVIVVHKIHSKALSDYTALLLDFNRFNNGIIMLHGMNTLYTANPICLESFRAGM